MRKLFQEMIKILFERKLLIVVSCRCLLFMKALDNILKQLQDSQWHNLDEIKKGMYIPSEKLNMLLAFLEKQSLIIIEEGKLKITQLGTKFLFL